MKWTQWLSAAISLGLLATAGCADKDPVSAAKEEGTADLSPAAKLVVSAIGLPAAETRALVAASVIKDGTPAANVDVVFTRNRRAYQWKGVQFLSAGVGPSTGETQVEISSSADDPFQQRGTGYYTARATDRATGTLVGQWANIPISEGNEVRVTLVVGQQYAQLSKAVPMSISLTSSAFADGAPIPTKYSAYSDNISPALAWGNLPPGTGSLALVMSDPDTPVGYIHHWILYNLPANLTGLAENLAKTGTLANGASQISLPSDQPGGYFGPRPPSGAGSHHYYFKLYALDPGALPLGASPTRQEILSAIEAHTLAMGRLVGTYAQP